MAKEVKIQLTAAQKAKIKAATGKTLSEIRVSTLGKNIAVSAGQKSTRMQAEALRGESPRSVGAESLRGESPRAVGAESLRGESPRAVGAESLRGESPRSIGSESLRSDSFRAGDDDA
jgi:hypothetical protein